MNNKQQTPNEGLLAEVADELRRKWYACDYPECWQEMAKAVIPIIEKQTREKIFGQLDVRLQSRMRWLFEEGEPLRERNNE